MKYKKGQLILFESGLYEDRLCHGVYIFLHDCNLDDYIQPFINKDLNIYQEQDLSKKFNIKSYNVNASNFFEFNDFKKHQRLKFVLIEPIYAIDFLKYLIDENIISELNVETLWLGDTALEIGNDRD